VSKGLELPIIISCPHAGTTIPKEIAKSMNPKFQFNQPDADWLVHRLYEFAAEFGITIMYGFYSRYVIDLNRDPKGAKLYSDGRSETELCPTKTFAGEPIYLSKGPEQAEISQRLEEYYLPYHQHLQKLLGNLKRTHKNVLLFEAHSIARSVPTIQKSPFPDLMLGDQDGKTAHPDLSALALKTLQSSNYKVAHNNPFKGGFITRDFGKPETGVHAMQLEMSQDVYLKETMQLDSEKTKTLQPLLKNLLTQLADALKRMN